MFSILRRRWLRGNQPTQISTNRRRHYSPTPPGITVHQVRRILAGNATVIVRGKRPFSSKTESQTYWQESGWDKIGNSLFGRYRVGNRSYEGEVELTGSVIEPFKFYIRRPPRRLLNGDHSACFHNRHHEKGPGWYWIHFSIRPEDIDSGIIQIETEF